MISQKFILSQKDFAPFVEISENTDFDKLGPYLIAAQNEQLREVLGNDLFNEFIEFYELIISITNITAGNPTSIAVADLTGIANDYYFEIENVSGTVGTDINKGLNGKQFQVQNKSGNGFQINADTTGLNYTANTGKLKNFLSPAYYELRKELIPFLAYTAYLRYIPKSNLHPTPYGYRVKKNPDSDPASAEMIGLAMKQVKVSADFWKNQLLEFLENNISSYPLFSSSVATKEKIGNSSIPIFPRKRQLFNNKRPR